LSDGVRPLHLLRRLRARRRLGNAAEQDAVADRNYSPRTAGGAKVRRVHLSSPVIRGGLGPQQECMPPPADNDLGLAALEFYGLLSFSVGRRTAETGIRMAMGATPVQVHALVLRKTLWILIAGIVPGIVLTEFASWGVQSLLFGSGGIDLWALSFAIGVL